MPVRFSMNTGYVMVNPYSNKPFSADKIEVSYSCFNLKCGTTQEEQAIIKWNEENA